MPYDAPQSDPYNPAVPNYDPETLPLDEVWLEAMRAHTLGLRVALPATITAVNTSENQRVDVLPSLMSRPLDQAVAVPMPAIKNVPVMMPMGQSFAIKLPLSVGDAGLLVFCDRSLDAWAAGSGGAPVDPQDSRQHDLTDAVFVPGLVPFAMQQTDATTDMVIKAGTAEVRLQQSGRFKLGNGSAETYDLLDQAMGKLASVAGNLSSALTQTQAGFNAVASASLTGTASAGPVVFATPFATALVPALTALNQLQSTATQLQTAVQQLQTTFETLKGQ